MNTIRSGKIARLPEAIREQVNKRLANHESSTSLLAWLNALPEVQAVLTREFGGETISRNNLHNWRQNGHQEWLRVQQAGELMERLGTPGNEMAAMDAGAVLGTMTTFAAARYVVEMKKLDGRGDADGRAWDRMRAFCQDVVALRRTEHLAQRLEFDREKYEAIAEMTKS
jgi:hypothetical protein